MTNHVLFMNWTTIGLGFALALWTWRRRFALPILVPEASLIRARVKQRRHGS